VQNALSLADQLKLFKEYVNKLKATVGENRTSEIVSQSVYLVCGGSNDITNTYFVLPIRRWTYNVPAYTDMMVNWASIFIQVIILASLSFVADSILQCENVNNDVNSFQLEFARSCMLSGQEGLG